jgi:hypothetical protein
MSTILESRKSGASLLLTQLGLTVALIVRMRSHSLTHLDAQLAATTMILSTKEVLATHWMIYITSSVQFLGFIVLGIGMGMLTMFTSPAPGCESFSVEWIGRIEPLGQGPPTIFWVYLCWCVLSWFLNVLLAIRLTSAYHRAECSENPGPHYSSKPSTELSNFSEPFVAYLVSSATVQSHLSNFDLKADSDWKTTGQTMALVAAIFAVFRLLWWFGTVKRRKHGAKFCIATNKVTRWSVLTAVRVVTQLFVFGLMVYLSFIVFLTDDRISGFIIMSCWSIFLVALVAFVMEVA